MLLEQQWTRQQLLKPSTRWEGAVRTWPVLQQFANPSPPFEHEHERQTPNAKRQTPGEHPQPATLAQYATRRHPNPKFEDEDEAPGEERRLTRAQTTYRAYRATQTREVSSSQSRMRFDTREQTPGVSGPDKGYRGT